MAYHKELSELADSLGLKHATSKTIVTALEIPADIQVIFFLSVPNSIKEKLLSSAKLLIYTPRNEHLGIVPLEAMLAGLPVLAANEGGPTETVVDGQTGWLRDVTDVEEWTNVMDMILNGSINDAALQKIGYQGKQRVKHLFSKEKMTSRLDEEIKAMSKTSRPPIVGFAGSLALLVFIFLGIGSAMLFRSQQ